MGYKLREEVEKIIDEAFSFYTPEQIRSEGGGPSPGGIPQNIYQEIADELEAKQLPYKIFRVDD